MALLKRKTSSISTNTLQKDNNHKYRCLGCMYLRKEQQKQMWILGPFLIPPTRSVFGAWIHRIGLYLNNFDILYQKVVVLAIIILIIIVVVVVIIIRMWIFTPNLDPCNSINCSITTPFGLLVRLSFLFSFSKWPLDKKDISLPSGFQGSPRKGGLGCLYITTFISTKNIYIWHCSGAAVAYLS